MRTFIKRKPLICFGFIILTAYLGGALILVALSPLLGEMTKEGKGALMMAIRSLLALGLVGWLGWWTQVGLGGPSQWRNVRLLWLLAPLPFLPLLDGVSASNPGRIAFLALAALFVAVNEEILYRGLLLQTLLPWGAVRAVLLLAALFGLAHLPNIFVGGEPGFELLRLGMTVGGAVGLAALRLRTNALWALILAHWGLDFTEYVAANGIPALGAAHEFSSVAIYSLIGYNILLGLVGLYLLRGLRAQEVRSLRYEPAREMGSARQADQGA